MESRFLGTGLVVFAGVCFGTLGLSSRMAEDLGLGTLPYVAWRSGLGGTVLVAWLLALVMLGRQARPRLAAYPTATRVALLAAAVSGALLNLAVFAAFERTIIALALITFYTYPALVTLGAARFFGEPVDRRRVGALILASVGLVLVVLAPAIQQGDMRVDLLGVGLAFVAACFQTAYVLISGRALTSVPTFAASAFVVAFAGVVFVLLTLVAGQATDLLLPFSDTRLWPWVFMAAIVGAALPTTAMMAGIRRIGAIRTAILMTLEPVVGVLLAALFLAERPAPLQLVGGLAVLVAGVILQTAPRAVESRPETVGAHLA